MRLLAAPFQDWVRRMVLELGLEALNQRVGHDLHKHASGEYRTVAFDLADEVLAAAGSHLSDLYPELYDSTGDEPMPARCGGWKRPDIWVRYSHDQLRLLYKLYVEQFLSIEELAKRTYEKLGYASHGAAAKAIANGWRRMGLPMRSRVETSRMVHIRHGLTPKHGSNAGYHRYRREHGMLPPYRPVCRGFKMQPPRKGQPCNRPAMNGSDFCVNHDPMRALENQARCAAMRKRIVPPEVLPMEPFRAWLDALAAEHGSLKAACSYHGLRYDAAWRYRRGEGTDAQPKTTITRKTVEAWLEATGTDLQELYPTTLRAAA